MAERSREAPPVPPSPAGKGVRGLGFDGAVKRQHVSEVKQVRARCLRGEMTGAEKALWERLRRSALGVHFRRQQVLRGFIVDFYCHSAGLVIEVDGGVHEQLRASDAERDAVLCSMGLRVLRVSNEQIETDMEGVLGLIVGCLGS